jgi:hypothetical protein
MGPLLRLPVLVPPFFLEACGYRGTSRYVAMRWVEHIDELWLTDNGHAARGVAGPLAMLWRRDGGPSALERFRIERDNIGRTPWLLIDRERRHLFLGAAPDVWRVVEGQQPHQG